MELWWKPTVCRRSVLKTCEEGEEKKEEEEGREEQRMERSRKTASGSTFTRRKVRAPVVVALASRH